MINNIVKANFGKLVDESVDARATVREYIQEGKWRQAEPNDERRIRFNLKDKIRQKQNGKESQIGDTLDWLDVSFFAEGNNMIRAVGYVTVLTEQSTTTGTGFLISNELVMTNNHVIASAPEAKQATITFNKENDENGKPLATTVFRLDPDRFFLTSSQEELDFSIVALGARVFGELNADALGYFILSDAPDKHVLGMPVNIIQHPLDMPKKVSFRKNDLVYRSDNSLLYEADTETCSSGSPVCNDYWDLVAIHHWGEPYKAKRDNPDSDLPNYVNEGIRISAIYKYLTAELEKLPTDKQRPLLEALSFAKTQPSIAKKVPSKQPPVGLISKPANNVNSQEKEHTPFSEKRTIMTNQENEIKLVIPIEVTVEVGSYQASADRVKNIESQAELRTSAEANKIDTDYSNRSGYDSGFVSGFTVDLPVIKDENNIAPLKGTESNAKAGVLKYEHFALVLNKKYRAAFFTATNIDGETYKSVNRKTGDVTPRENMNEDEGETWYNDERVDEKYHLNQPFFSGWSHLFDRGHLTRRTDPSWGTKKLALRADADTFHFSNCSIQHFRFNQTIPYWQGLERFVLENGLLKADVNSRLIVFQGPVYDDDIDLWADDFQIPSRFFKIVIWNSSHGLKAVGLMADQSSLLSEERRALGQPHAVPFVNVNQWRTRIADIEKLTRLDFGETIRNADTISLVNQPNVGAEAMIKIPIKSWEDLLK